MFEREGERPELIVNEFAPRVHNSGHWTLDACLVSQFENHIRAICGWPLGETARHSDAVMTNLIGADVDKWRDLAAEPGTAVHLYGKAEARPGRKMGHVTRLASEELKARIWTTGGPSVTATAGCGTLTGSGRGYIWPPAPLPNTNGQTES